MAQDPATIFYPNDGEIIPGNMFFAYGVYTEGDPSIGSLSGVLLDATSKTEVAGVTIAGPPTSAGVWIIYFKQVATPGGAADFIFDLRGGDGKSLGKRKITMSPIRGIGITFPNSGTSHCKSMFMPFGTTNVNSPVGGTMTRNGVVTNPTRTYFDPDGGNWALVFQNNLTPGNMYTLDVSNMAGDSNSRNMLTINNC